ncbi:MAG: VapC toxin family PIN domain ribonuclease [Coriobacteriaceae bacterium]|nr:VapC toxin family PIN domain ribonuclease [Coriobacteriaceae bacterium]
MSRLVADACALITVTVPQSRSESARAVLASADAVVAPDLALVECTNALWKFVHAGQCSEHEALGFLDAITNAEVDFQDSAPLLPRALELATLLGHPVYDCVYLTLAIVEQAPVVTTDRRLADTAVAAGLGDLVLLVEAD